MRFNILTLLLCLILATCSRNIETANLIIENVTIIDPINGQRANQSVVVDGNQILWVGASDEVLPYQAANIIDGTGQFLIPGLWDAHVHLTYEPLLGFHMFDLLLANGITSIRDTGGQLDDLKPFRERAAADSINIPRIKVAGPLLDGEPVVYSGSTPGRPGIGVGIDSPEAARAMVDRLIEADVDLLKAYELLKPEVYLALMEYANEKDLLVTGHIPLSMDLREASKAGLSSVEHMRNLEMACSKDADELLRIRKTLLENEKGLSGFALRSKIHTAQRNYAIQNEDPILKKEVMAALKTNNTWQVPTLTILAAWKNRLYDKEAWRNTFNYLPDSLRLRWQEAALSLTERPLDADRVEFADWGYRTVKDLADAQVDLMAGTDTPIFLLTPGFSLHEELRLLVHSGLTPMQALAAATTQPAKYFNMQDQLGTVEQGKLADLVLLNANPLEDITNTQKISAVIRNGHLHDREALDIFLSNK